jgi:hypothetical protein
MKLGHDSSSSSALASRRTGVSKPSVSQQIAGLSALALIAPKLGEAGGDTEFPQLGALAPSDRKRGAITLFCCGPIAEGEQQLAAHTVQLGLIFTAFRTFNNVDRLGEMLQPF